MKAVKTTPLETQGRIVDAAIACVKRWGIQKVTLNDIAKEAGVTRPTVYSYFKSRDDVLRYAMLQSAYGFGEKLLKHVGKFETPGQRVLEAFLFTLKRLPKEPYLVLIIDADFSEILNQHALSTEEGQAVLRSLFTTLLVGMTLDEAEVDEMAEFSARLLLSLLAVEGRTKRSDTEMRAFLIRRLLPALGLPV